MNSLTSIRPFNLVTANVLKWTFSFFALIIVQITVLKHIAIPIRYNSAVQPDLVLILLFFYGIRHSQLSSTVTGFTAGLFLDAFSGGMLGLHALTKTVSGFLIGYAPKAHKIQKVVHFCLLFFAINLIHDLLFNTIYIIDDFSFKKLLIERSFPSSVYSVSLSGIAFYWLKS